MAKIWSSIRESEIQEFERDVKDLLVMMCKGNYQMCKQVVDHTKLFIRYDNLKFRVKSTLVTEEERLNKMWEELNKVEEKWQKIEKTFDSRYLKLIHKFSSFITNNGLFKLTNVITFGIWITIPAEQTDYYVYRR